MTSFTHAGLSALAFVLLTAPTATLAEPPSDDKAATPVEAVQSLTLKECLEMALRDSHRRPASRFAMAIAEAQHRQVLAGYWPQVNFQAGYQRLDQPLNFLFPASQIALPAESITLPAGSAVVTIPAGAFGPGFPASPIQMPVSFPGQTVNTPAQIFPIPEQNVKVLDQNLLTGTLDLKWLLFDGGMRKGERQESGGGLDAARQEVRRTDLEITDTVKRYYWGAVLARQLFQLGQDTLARMEVTLRVTENMYRQGSEKVNKSDYLDNAVMVETVRSVVAHLEKNEKMAQAVLASTVGKSWTASVKPSDAEIPFAPYEGDLTELAGAAYQFSPDWEKLEAGLRAAGGAVTTAKSGYYPKIALTGELHRWWNGGYNAGLSTPQNRAGWVAGIGLEIPLFNGFLTQNRIDEARARWNQLKEQQFLLREGIGLQIKDLVLGLDAAMKADQATSRAMKSAEDNLDLNTRAYENGLVETDKVIRAQLTEALMSAQHYMARYEYTALLSQLGLVVGTEVGQKLDAAR